MSTPSPLVCASKSRARGELGQGRKSLLAAAWEQRATTNLRRGDCRSGERAAKALHGKRLSFDVKAE